MHLQTVLLIPALLASACSMAVAAEPLRIDFNPDNGRSDIRSRNAVQLEIRPGPMVRQTVSGVTLTLRPVNSNSELTWGWWKGGFDHGAALASDGVTSPQGDGVEIAIDGLTSGPHTITTWHNAWDAGSVSPFTTQLDGLPVHPSVTPSHRVVHDDDAVSCHFRVDAVAGRTTVLRFLPDSSQGAVMINGIEFDGPDPSRMALRPGPANDEEHAIESPELTWRPAAGVATHRVWLSSNRNDLEAETPDTRWLVGNQPTTLRKPLDPFREYFWRVDSVYSGGASGETISRGRLWRFRIRRLAFPGAEGYGRFAAGGRNGRVIPVTNLNDSGPGSLRDAVEAEGPRTVVFRTGGTIILKSKLVVRHPYLTIAGQTAPGDGICVRGFTFGCLGTHDVILRHLRIRVGDEAHQTMDGTGFASSDHCIMDHCSVSWSIDEGVSSRGAGHITVQRCLIAEALNIADHRKYQPGKGHSYAGSISGDVGSFHHNLLAHCAGRNWSLAGGLNRGGQYSGRLDIRNNVVFNWVDRTTDGGAKAVNFVGNLYIPGPATRRFHLLKPDAGSESDPQQYFVQGNRLLGHPEYETRDWNDQAVVVDPLLLPRIRLQEPFCEPYVMTHSVDELEDNVLNDVGASHSGLDALDRRILADVRGRRTSTTGSRSGLPGIIDTQTDSGGWPELNPGTAPEDSDSDGIPNDWETANSLDPTNAADAGVVAADGYTHLERWMNQLAEAGPPPRLLGSRSHATLHISGNSQVTHHRNRQRLPLASRLHESTADHALHLQRAGEH